MRVDRRGVLLVLATVVAVALVGLAARGDQGDTGDPALTLAPGTGDAASRIVMWLVVLYVVGSLLLVPLALAGGGPRRARKKRSLLGQLLALFLLVAALWFARDLRQPTTGAPDEVTQSDDGVRPDDEVAEDDPPSPFGTLLLAGLGALVVAGAAALLGRSRLRRDGALVAPDVDDERVLVAAGAPGASLAERAAAEPDPRQAVLLAFAAAEERLGRPPATSPREWLASVRSEPLAVLVGRYEVARFSHHEVTEADRRAALDALAALP